MEGKLEVVTVPAADIDRSKQFYAEQLGFNVDVDHRAGDAFRVVQLTPPGSACSISMGKGITEAVPGSVRGLHLVVSDIDAAHAELVERGVEASEVFHFEAGKQVPGLADTAINGFMDGMHAGVLVAAAVALIGAVIAFVWLPARASYDDLAESVPDGAGTDDVADSLPATPEVAAR